MMNKKTDAKNNETNSKILKKILIISKTIFLQAIKEIGALLSKGVIPNVSKERIRLRFSLFKIFRCENGYSFQAISEKTFHRIFDF